MCQLDGYPDTGLVFPNWIDISDDLEVIGGKQRRRLHADGL
jgi:hypothetical protein